MIAEFDLIVDGIAKSKQLVSLAESGEWEQFVELDKQRQSSLANLQLDNLELTAEQHVKIQAKMEELIDLNNQLEAVCTQNRTELTKKIKKLSHGSKATKAYSQTS